MLLPDVEEADVSDWLRRYAVALGEDPLSNDEVSAILELARDVAHTAQRQFAPLSTFLAGVYAARSAYTQGARPGAVSDALEVARRLLNDDEENAGTEPTAGAVDAAASPRTGTASTATAPPSPPAG